MGGVTLFGRIYNHDLIVYITFWWRRGLADVLDTSIWNNVAVSAKKEDNYIGQQQHGIICMRRFSVRRVDYRP
jgi:hypothetical protein